jgi:sorting nexin-4
VIKRLWYILVQAALRARDQKQVDFEELSNYLQHTIGERERTMYPGRKLGDRPTVNITGFLTDKVNEARGVNMAQARQEKLERLEHRITEVYVVTFRMMIKSEFLMYIPFHVATR